MTDETTTEAVKERYSHALMNTFGPPKLVLTRGEGARVWDADGKEYLDLLGGIAAVVLKRAEFRLGELVLLLLTLGMAFGHVRHQSPFIILAVLIAWPVAWWVMRDWLNTFDARIDLGPTPFVVAGLLALAIAIGTVSGHALRVSRTNPINALRYE